MTRKEYLRRYREDHREAELTRQRNWRAANPDKMRAQTLRRLYGITLEQHDALLSSQGSCCAICRTDAPGKKTWSVDHCHNTSTVRGLLCNNCNLMLGHAKDSKDTLQNAIDYLRRTSA